MEYGIASASNPYIEPLGAISRRRAEATVADSLTVWPDVYLVHRTSPNGEWQQVEAAR